MLACAGAQARCIRAGLQKRKRYLPDREASLIKKEYCRYGPHPPQVISPRARPPLAKGAGCIGPLPPGTPGLATLAHGLHCTVGTPNTLHQRPLLVPHCTPRLSHLSVGGNTRRLETAGQLDMQEPGLGDHWGRLLMGR